VPFTKYDRARITKYLIELGLEYLEKLQGQKRELLTCQYRDIENKKCAIHPVRPEICRMQGYYKGLECPHQPQFANKTREEGMKRLII
jgi:Fe-S-cluster containining protein